MTAEQRRDFAAWFDDRWKAAQPNSREVAHALGWGDRTGYLAQWRDGRALPTASTLVKIAPIVGFSVTEALLRGGYVAELFADFVRLQRLGEAWAASAGVSLTGPSGDEEAWFGYNSEPARDARLVASGGWVRFNEQLGATPRPFAIAISIALASLPERHWHRSRNAFNEIAGLIVDVDYLLAGAREEMRRANQRVKLPIFLARASDAICDVKLTADVREAVGAAYIGAWCDELCVEYARARRVQLWEKRPSAPGD